MSATLEREYRLIEPNGFALEALPDTLGMFHLGAPKRQRIHTTYYDTAALDLLRWGARLHYRPVEGWALQLYATAPERYRYRTTFRFSGNANVIPAGALDLVTAMLHGRTPLAVAELRTIRTSRSVANADDATALAAIVHDDVRVVRGATVVRRFHHVDIELRETAPDALLDVLCGRLWDAGAGREQAPSKLVAALGGEDPGDVLPLYHLTAESRIDATIYICFATAVDAIVRLDAFLRHDPDREMMHRVRVHIRRLRAALSVFKPLLKRRWAEELNAHVSLLEDAFASARAADVPATLRSAAYVATLDALVDAAKNPHVKHARKLTRTVAAALMHRVLKHTKRAAHRAKRQPGRRAVERLSIATKSLRYAAEALAPVIRP